MLECIFEGMKPHKKLDAWNLGIALVRDVYSLTGAFPKEELYGVISQMRRCALSVPLNVAEGAARSTPKEFIRFLDIAIGSLAELDTLLVIAFELSYIDQFQFDKLSLQADTVGKVIYGLKKSLVSKI